MYKFHKRKNAATLIEMVMVILVLAIIAGVSSGILIYFSQLFMYSPRQLDAQGIGQEVMETMIEGNAGLRGIRFCRAVFPVTDLDNHPSATQFAYTYGYPASEDGKSVRLRWSSADKHLYYRISSDGGTSWSPEVLFPYYIPATSTIDGKDTPGVIFVYQKADGSLWDPATEVDTALIRQVLISIKVNTLSGNFPSSAIFTSSVEIKGFS